LLFYVMPARLWRIEEERRVFRNVFVSALALTLLSLLPGGCGREATRAPCPAGQTCFHLGNSTEPGTLDPQKSTGVYEDSIISELLVGLTQDDAHGRAEPGMAERWSVSPDGLTWTFHLRPALWSDGVPVTAADFVYALRRTVDPRSVSEFASLLYVIRNARPIVEGKAAVDTLGVREVDPRTLEITLEHPAPYLPELLKHHSAYPLPRHVVERWGAGWTKPGRYVSNGPFVLAEWRLGDFVRLVRNPRYWDSRSVCLDQVFYYPTSDSVAAERRVLRGELDANTDIQSNRIAHLRENPRAAPYVRTHTYLGTAYIAFNSGPKSRNPALRDPRVRRALSLAIDRDFITRKLLRGGQAPAYGFTPPGVANYPVQGVRVAWADWPLSRRQAEARRLLAEAGYGAGGRRLKLELKHRNTPDPMLLAPAIQADWRAVGVDVQLAQQETQIAYQDYRLRNFDAADAAWIADYNDPLTFLYIHRSDTGSQNYGDYANPAFDALLDAADREPDAGRRAALLARAEAMMLADAPVAPVFFYVSKNLVSPRFSGWTDNLVDRHRMRLVCPKRAGSDRP
jgi:oligopeptide transport system substrate-binding protein